MRAAAAILLVTLSAVASAEPLGMDYVVNETQGATKRYLLVRVKVELATDGKLRAVEHGTSHDTRTVVDKKTDLQNWQSTWSGTWKQTATSLSLDLLLDKRRCTRSENGSPASCGGVDKTVHFDCKAEVVKLTEEPGKPPRNVWRCVTSTQLDLAPSTWTLGKPGCVKLLDNGRKYEKCTVVPGETW